MTYCLKQLGKVSPIDQEGVLDETLFISSVQEAVEMTSGIGNNGLRLVEEEEENLE